MIIRREHRRNFTTLGNEVVDDTRLSYEALGLLTYLLSRPDDWEVRIEQLRTRAKIGKDKIYRIVGELQDAGYLEHERVYEDGKVKFGRWIVREDPGPKGEQISTAGDLRPGNPDEGRELHPENLHPENLRPENPDAYKGLTDTKSRKTPKTHSPRARAKPTADPEREISPPVHQGQALVPDPRFDEIATAWPIKDNMAEAREVWDRMAEADRADAYGYHATFLAETGAKRKFIEQLVKWFRGASWRYATKPKAAPTKVSLDAFSKPWWAEWWRLLGAGDKASAFMASEALRGKGWLATMPDASGMVAVKIGADGFDEWIAAAEKRGARLPVPDEVPVIWVPCERAALWTPRATGAAA